MTPREETEGGKNRWEERKQQRVWRQRQKMRLKPKGHRSLQIAEGPLQHWNILTDVKQTAVLTYTYTALYA